VLQWGHAFSSVETESRRTRACGGRRASMGPRFFKRGNGGAGMTCSHSGRGFNGATLFQAWKRRYGPEYAASLLDGLQWGHAFSSVETCSTLPRPKIHRAILSLQWGHAFSSVETFGIKPMAECLDMSFNGATLFQAWKPWASAPDGSQGHRRASMGPRFFKRGNRWIKSQVELLKGASMGPRFFKRGNFTETPSKGVRLNRFNGATLFQAWKRWINRHYVTILESGKSGF